LADRIEVIHHETSPTNRNDAVFAENPLGKVPILIRPGEMPIFDSDVICAYFDAMHDGPSLIPGTGEARWRALTMQAVAQGMCEAGIMLRWETVRRPEELRYRPLSDGYTEKLVESYDWLERNLDEKAPLHVGHVAVATALSWIEFRQLPGFRDHCPQLSKWLDRFEDRPSMRATLLAGETHD
jgi:glutathione S-transferase